MVLNLFVKYTFYLLLDRNTTTLSIYQIISSNRRISKAKCSTGKRKSLPNTPHYSRYELDSYADTTVAGSNCILLYYTYKECNVSPYCDNYESITNMPIVIAATMWQSLSTGQTCILVFNEAL